MADQNKKEKIGEREISTGEQRIEFKKEGQVAVEKKEISSDEKIVTEELKREIEMMELDDELKEEAKKKAQKIEFLGEKEKIEHLLQLARERGVIFAVRTAREMKDPYLLDILHDILAKEGYYQKFMK